VPIDVGPVSALRTELIPRRIPGKRYILADALSRADRLVQTEWTLHRGRGSVPCWDVGRSYSRFVRHQAEQATSPVLLSLPDDEALGVDSLSVSWEGLIAYAYPPTPLNLAVLNKAASSRIRLYLIAPCWPNQAWFPGLLELLTDHPPHAGS
jgi:hypothetical protein